MTLSLFLLAAMADPAALAPSGKWVVEYADSMCVLSSGARALDQATCGVLKASGRFFSPALDKAGKPVVSHLVVPVRWVLPA